MNWSLEGLSVRFRYDLARCRAAENAVHTKGQLTRRTSTDMIKVQQEAGVMTLSSKVSQESGKGQILAFESQNDFLRSMGSLRGWLTRVLNV